jgi:hypothetical protein
MLPAVRERHASTQRHENVKLPRAGCVCSGIIKLRAPASAVRDADPDATAERQPAAATMVGCAERAAVVSEVATTAAGARRVRRCIIILMGVMDLLR